MKRIIIPSVCFIVGASIGWYLCSFSIVYYKGEMLKNYVQLRNEYETEMTFVNKELEEEHKAAAPWAASSASIALAALRHLDTNDVEDTKFRLAAIIGNYYRGHLSDGDTNLLANIASYAATSTVLSNAIKSREIKH